MEKKENIPFNVDLAKRGGIFISGNRGSGKTNLGKIFVDKLLKNDVIVRVFDNSQAWRESSVPNLISIEREANISVKWNSNESYIFDISKLYIEEQKEFVRGIVSIEYQNQTKLAPSLRKWRVFVFEECEILATTHSLRSKNNPILSLVCVGRNFKMSFLAISQRPSLVSTTMISLSDQIYIGRSHEQNDKKKLANWLGSRVEQIEDLDVGEFIFDRGKETIRFKAPLFRSETKPFALPTYPLTTQVETKPNLTKKKEPSSLDLLIGITSMLAFLMFLGALTL